MASPVNGPAPLLAFSLSSRRTRVCYSGSGRRGSLESRQSMTREELLSRITINPDICFGKPTIRGHRLWVSLVLDLLASGMTHQEILRDYPGLEDADILACIA
jgi:uncharacterized protein (DUF433 family)